MEYKKTRKKTLSNIKDREPVEKATQSNPQHRQDLTHTQKIFSFSLRPFFLLSAAIRYFLSPACKAIRALTANRRIPVQTT